MLMTIADRMLLIDKNVLKIFEHAAGSGQLIPITRMNFVTYCM